MLVDLSVDLGRLTALTRRVAAEVLAGRHDLAIDPEHRSYRRLRSDDTVDVWLIGWATGQATELHDQGDPTRLGCWPRHRAGGLAAAAASTNSLRTRTCHRIEKTMRSVVTFVGEPQEATP